MEYEINYRIIARDTANNKEVLCQYRSTRAEADALADTWWRAFPGYYVKVYPVATGLDAGDGDGDEREGE